MGAFVGHPSIELVDKTIGKSEFNSIKSKLDSKDIIIRTNGKRIECEILNEDENNVYFNMTVNGKTLKTQLGKDQIEKIEYAE